jgi:predicted nuclease of restriction endonuclease-like (RecB) superfamily
MRPSTSIAFDYAAFVTDLKTRIASARLTAARAVNSELVGLYWDIGAAIREKQAVQGWGDGVVERLSHDLKRAFTGTTGFSAINLWRMRQLHQTYTAPDFLSQLVRETAPRAKAARGLPGAPSAKLAQVVREMVIAIPWGHHVNLLAKIAQPAQRLYYLQGTARFGWSRNVLLNQIKAQAYERSLAEGKSHNFPTALPEHLAEQAEEALKSSYNLEFLGIRQHVKERELEDRLIDRLRDFILELSYGFCFIGRQHRVTLGRNEYFIDLLLSPLLEGYRGRGAEGRQVRTRVRRQDGLLPEPAQRERAHARRCAIDRHHIVCREGQPRSRVRVEEQDQPDWRCRVPVEGCVASAAAREAAHGKAAGRRHAGRYARVTLKAIRRYFEVAVGNAAGAAGPTGPTNSRLSAHSGRWR